MIESSPRRRFRLFLPSLLLLLLAAGWCAFWFYAADRAEKTIAGWLEREAALGRIYDCGTRKIGGFPFRIEVRCADATAKLNNLKPPLSLTLPQALVAAQIYQPTLLISEFTGPLNISIPDQPDLIANWRSARTSVRGQPRAPERVSVVLDGVSIERKGGAEERLFAGEHVEMHARVISGSLRDQPVIDIALNLRAATAPSLHPLARVSTDFAIDTNLRGLQNLSPKPWSTRFREMQQAGGGIAVRNLRIAHGEWLLSGAGDVGLTATGGLEGELRVTVAGLDKLLQELGVEYLSRPSANADRLNSALNALDRLMPGLGSAARERAGAGVAAGVALIGEPAQLEGRSAVSLPLRLTNGTAYLGPVPLGQAPRLF